MTYTTLDGKSLAWPQGVTVVHVGPFSYLQLSNVYMPPPPSDLSGAR
jgi:hypothetical protein